MKTFLQFIQEQVPATAMVRNVGGTSIPPKPSTLPTQTPRQVANTEIATTAQLAAAKRQQEEAARKEAAENRRLQDLMRQSQAELDNVKSKLATVFDAKHLTTGAGAIKDVNPTGT